METLYKIRDIRSDLQLLERDFEQSHGISFNEAKILCGLRSRERMSSGEIGELIGQPRSNASKIIASVERKGLVERGIGSDDKRRMYFVLTSRGRELGEAVGKSGDMLDERLCAALGKNMRKGK